MLLISPLLTHAMYIEVFAGEDRVGSGTGFIVEGPSGRMLVSNRHVVVGREPETNAYKDPQGRQPTRIRVSSINELVQTVSVDLNLFDDDRNELWVEHPTYAHRLDLVGLPWPHGLFTSTATGRMYASGAPVQIRVPAPVIVLGYPLRFHGGVEGLPVAVSGILASTPGLPINGDLPRFLIDSRTRSGLSGAPVIFYSEGAPLINEQGTLSIGSQTQPYELLGIYSGRIRDDADIGYVITTAAISEMIHHPAQGVLLVRESD
ncbi:hypothetical protein [Microbacterium sp.]|uniref:hypothetical protein n=1 Tax=Microbacterium sp. TaxID=51671 RepID=UPI003C76035F